MEEKGFLYMDWLLDLIADWWWLILIVCAIYFIGQSAEKKAKAKEDTTSQNNIQENKPNTTPAISQKKKQSTASPVSSSDYKNKSTYELENLLNKSIDELEQIRKAERGDVEAQISLVTSYWQGNIGEIRLDKPSALRWKKRIVDSAVQGNKMAMAHIGNYHAVLIRVGEPLPNTEDYQFHYDKELAKRYHDQILAEAEAGNAEAMLAAYQHIVLPKKDWFHYLMGSFDLGCEDAIYFLYQAYYWAISDKKRGYYIFDNAQLSEQFDLETLEFEMLKWLEIGALSNSLYADECQYKLADHYYEDKEKYLKYIKLAMSLGHLGAKKDLEVMERKYGKNLVNFR